MPLGSLQSDRAQHIQKQPQKHLSEAPEIKEAFRLGEGSAFADLPQD